MEAELVRARQYRDRAEEIREIAKQTKDITAKKTLVTLAKDYDHMAVVVEKRGLPKAH